MTVKAVALITLTRVNDGATGPKGNDGKGIKSTSVTYQAWNNGTTHPPSNSGWGTTPPKTTADNPYLWTRTVITYSDNTQSTSYSVGSTPEGIVVGGRNLLRNTAFKDVEKKEDVYVDNKYTKFSNNTLKLICDNTSGTSHKYTVVGSLKSTWDLADVLGQDITISMWIYIEAVGQLDGYEFRILFTHNGKYQWFNPNRSYPVCVPSASELKVGWNYIYATFRVAEDSTEVNFNFTCNSYPGKKSICWISSPKAEFGNKPTAWTPAPEDVDEAINTERTERQSAIETKANEITSKVSETYVSNSAFEHYQNTVSTQFTQTKKDFTWSINQSVTDAKNEMSGQIDNVNGRVDGLKQTTDNVNSYMSFDNDALTLGKSDSTFKTQITNQEWAILKDTEKVTYINDKTMYITDGQFTESLKVGNFGFVPRANGSLDFKKIR